MVEVHGLGEWFAHGDGGSIAAFGVCWLEKAGVKAGRDEEWAWEAFFTAFIADCVLAFGLYNLENFA
jgi:hypothetical protein